MNQFVLYGGRYFEAIDTWAWCPSYSYGSKIEETCTGVINYQNWLDHVSSVGNCMGGIINGTVSTNYNNYGWIQRDQNFINENSVYAMCKYNCESLTTPSPVSPVTPVYPTQQNLMYTLYTGDSSKDDDYGKIYSYVLDDKHNPVKQGDFNIPYKARLHLITFNQQRSVLEVIGDWYDPNNSNHDFMTLGGAFSGHSDSLFSGEKYFEVCYEKNVGTLVLSGFNHNKKTQVYIVTQNTEWPEITDSDKYLTPFVNPFSGDYWDFGVVNYQSKIYLVGGCTGTCKGSSITGRIQMMNLEDVTSISEAKLRSWTTLGYLSSSVRNSAVQFLNGLLMVSGYNQGGNIQYFNLQNNKPGVYENVINGGKFSAGLAWPGLYATNETITVFGGNASSIDCIQQTSSISSIASPWTCYDYVQTNLEGLEYRNMGLSNYLKYVTFYL